MVLILCVNRKSVIFFLHSRQQSRLCSRSNRRCTVIFELLTLRAKAAHRIQGLCCLLHKKNTPLKHLKTVCQPKTGGKANVLSTGIFPRAKIDTEWNSSYHIVISCYLCQGNHVFWYGLLVCLSAGLQENIHESRWKVVEWAKQESFKRWSGFK